MAVSETSRRTGSLLMVRCPLFVVRCPLSVVRCPVVRCRLSVALRSNDSSVSVRSLVKKRNRWSLETDNGQGERTTSSPRQLHHERRSLAALALQFDRAAVQDDEV